MKLVVGGATLVNDIFLADSFFTRFKGLMFKKDLPDDKGIILTPCNSVHTFFMKFNIDIAYIDKDMRIIEIFYNIPKGKMLPIRKNCKYVLEVKAGKLPTKEKLINKICELA